VYHISDSEITENGHYHFVISKEADDGNFVVVNCTTFRLGLHQEDAKCILNPGEYIGITKKSFIAFNFTRLLNDDALGKLREDGITVIAQPINASQELINRIQTAFEVSEDVPARFRPYGFYFR